MKISPDDVARIAKLARLRLDDEKQSLFAAQFEGILEHMDVLGELDTSGVDPLYSPVEHAAVLREDTVRRSCSRQEVLANAPQSDGSHFIVPKIL